MKRRELIKTGIAAAGVAALGLTGCGKKETAQENYNDIDITPKQTATYQFSTPLPFDFKLIDEIKEINSQYKKAQVTSLYNNIPLPLAAEFNEWYGCQKGRNADIKTYDEFAKYVKYAQKKGFNIVYLLNSPKAFSQEDFDRTKDSFYKLLDFIHDIGIKDIKVGNTQVASLVNEYKHKFNLMASTIFEYHNTLQYYHLAENYPNMKLFDMAIDENQNFTFLKNMRKLFPNVKLEVMVNEACMRGCPARISHASTNFKMYRCLQIQRAVGSLVYNFKIPRIYPWQLEYYSAIGVNNFKIVAESPRAEVKTVEYLRKYFNIVENGIDSNITVDEFFNYILFPFKVKIKNNVRLADIIQEFPDIRYFVKHGHECASACKVSCTYCYDCAKKIQDIIS